MTAECVKLINNLIDDLNPRSIMVLGGTVVGSIFGSLFGSREEEYRRGISRVIEYMEAIAKLKEIITLLEILREISSNDDAMKILKKIISLFNALTPNVIVNTEKINNLRAKLEKISNLLKQITILFNGNTGAGKSAIFNWLINNEFKESYDATIKHKKFEKDDVIYYDTSGAMKEDTEELKRNLVGRRVVAVYVFDISKYNQDETMKYIQMLKNQNEKFDNKLEIVAIGTHANKSRYTLLEIQNLQNHIRYQGVRCRIYELNPQEKKDFHPELSNVAIQDFILGKDE